mgnify:CR=1 FL=1
MTFREKLLSYITIADDCPKAGTIRAGLDKIIRNLCVRQTFGEKHKCPANCKGCWEREYREK